MEGPYGGGGGGLMVGGGAGQGGEGHQLLHEDGLTRLYRDIGKILYVDVREAQDLLVSAVKFDSSSSSSSRDEKSFDLGRHLELDLPSLLSSVFLSLEHPSLSLVLRQRVYPSIHRIVPSSHHATPFVPSKSNSTSTRTRRDES